jgi:hypothetical protein
VYARLAKAAGRLAAARFGRGRVSVCREAAPAVSFFFREEFDNLGIDSSDESKTLIVDWRVHSFSHSITRSYVLQIT